MRRITENDSKIVFAQILAASSDPLSLSLSPVAAARKRQTRNHFNLLRNVALVIVSSSAIYIFLFHSFRATAAALGVIYSGRLPFQVTLSDETVKVCRLFSSLLPSQPILSFLIRVCSFSLVSLSGFANVSADFNCMLTIHSLRAFAYLILHSCARADAAAKLYTNNSNNKSEHI